MLNWMNGEKSKKWAKSSLLIGYWEFSFSGKRLPLVGQSNDNLVSYGLLVQHLMEMEELHLTNFYETWFLD